MTRRALVASRSSRVGAERARSRCRPAKATERRYGTASTSAATGASTACSTSRASPNNATTSQHATTSPERSPRARPDEKHDELTNDTSPTASSAACGPTKINANHEPDKAPLDKGASDSPSTGRRGQCSSWSPGGVDGSMVVAGLKPTIGRASSETTWRAMWGRRVRGRRRSCRSGRWPGRGPSDVRRCRRG